MSCDKTDYVALEQQREAKKRADSAEDSRQALVAVYDKDIQRIILDSEYNMQQELEKIPETLSSEEKSNQRLDIMGKWAASKVRRIEERKRELESTGHKRNVFTVGDKV